MAMPSMLLARNSTTLSPVRTNVNNAYYFVGSPAASSPPSNVFHGGIGTSWNTAIFSDDRENYSVTPGSSTIITNIDPQHEHD
jgi:hypothetical protein